MAVNTPVAGTNLNAVPAPNKQTLASNYLSFTGGANDWSQQYLPELYESEVERYGDRSVASFLRMVGAEMPMTSDQVVWSEQGRLHLSYTGKTLTSGTGSIALGSGHGLRAGQTVVVADADTVAKARVDSVTDTAAVLKRYDKALFTTDNDFAA